MSSHGPSTPTRGCFSMRFRGWVSARSLARTSPRAASLPILTRPPPAAISILGAGSGRTRSRSGRSVSTWIRARARRFVVTVRHATSRRSCRRRSRHSRVRRYEVSLTIDRTALAGRLAEARERHGTPGASIAVLTSEGVSSAASGLLNIATGVDATTDSLFQIGSITKVWTATLVLQLVDEGLLDLDAPIRTYLPDFRVADEETSRGVSARHLLTHTSGIDGDHFADTGRGDD